MAELRYDTGIKTGSYSVSGRDVARAQRRTSIGTNAADSARATDHDQHMTKPIPRPRQPLFSLSPEDAARERQVQATVSGGALGGGVLLAGFGLAPALVGAALGGLLGYLFERGIDRKRTNQISS